MATALGASFSHRFRRHNPRRGVHVCGDSNGLASHGRRRAGRASPRFRRRQQKRPQAFQELARSRRLLLVACCRLWHERETARGVAAVFSD